MRPLTRLLLVLIAAAISAPVIAKCSASDFAVSDLSGRHKYDRLVIVAKVTNTGTRACGVQVKASSFDKGDSLLDTNDGWPASVRNIAPGASENFTMHLRGDRPASRFTVVPIDAREWRK